MMRQLFATIFLLAFVANLSFAREPWYWGPQDTAKLIPRNGIQFQSNKSFLIGSAIPTVEPTNAPHDSIYFSGTGFMYRKLDDGNTTNWTQIFDPGGAGMSNPMTTVGDIIYGAASGTPTRGAGNATTMRHFLTSQGSAGNATAPSFSLLTAADVANSDAAGTFARLAPIVNLGDLIIGGSPNGTSIKLAAPTGTALQILRGIGNGNVGLAPGYSSFTELSPLTTKGDLIVHNSVEGVRLPVGAHANGEVLTLDSSASQGVKWASASVTLNGGTGIGIATNNTIYQADEEWVQYTPTFTGFGTVSTQYFIARRSGGSLEVFGVFTSGTSTATEARITLGFKGGSGNVSTISGLVNAMYAGGGSFDTSVGALPTILMEASKNYMTFGLQNNSQNGLAKLNGDALIVNGVIFSISARFPIAGWQ